MAHVRSDIIETIAMNTLQEVPNIPLVETENLFDRQLFTHWPFDLILPSQLGPALKPR